MMFGVEGPHQPKNVLFLPVLLEQREKIDDIKEYGFNSCHGWTTRSPQIQLSDSTVMFPGKSEEFDTCRSSYQERLHCQGIHKLEGSLFKL